MNSSENTFDRWHNANSAANSVFDLLRKLGYQPTLKEMFSIHDRIEELQSEDLHADRT